MPPPVVSRIGRKPRPGGAAPPPPAPAVRTRARPDVEYVAAGGSALGEYLRSMPPWVDERTRLFGTDLYDRMQLDDQVSSSLRALVHSALADDLAVRPAVDDADEEGYGPSKQLLEFVERATAGLDLETWLFSMLKGAVGGGNRVSETVYSPVESGTDAGLWHVDRLKVKPRRSVAFVVDARMNLVGFLGLVPGQGSPAGGGLFDPTAPPANFLPRDKFVHFAWDPPDEDPRGSPLLSCVYTPWWEKLQAAREWLAHLARFGSGALVGTLPPNAEGRAAVDAQGNPTGEPEIDPAQDYTNKLVAFRNGSVLVKPYGSELDLLQSSNAGSAFLNKVDYSDRAIARGILLAMRTTMESKHGSKADSEQAQDVTGLQTRFIKRWAARAATEQLFRPLVKYNSGPEAARLWCPYASLSPVEHQDLGTTLTSVSQAYKVGFLKPSQLPWAYEQFGIPAATPEEMKPPEPPAAAPGQPPPDGARPPAPGDAPFYSPDQPRGQPGNAGQFGPGGTQAPAPRAVPPASVAYEKGDTAAEAARVLGTGAGGPHDWAALTGAPAGADVSVMMVYPGAPGRFRAPREATGPTVRVAFGGPGYDAVRYFYRDGGALVAHNAEITVRDKGKGLGSEIFARQVAGLVALGAARVECFAEGSPGDEEFNGYVTWPRLGYDGRVPDHARGRLPAEFAGLDTVQGVLARPGGAAAWKAAGTGFKAHFDLAEGSRSRGVLDAYLAERAARVPAPAPSAAFSAGATGEGGRGAEEIELAPWEEEALEAAWDKLTSGDALAEAPFTRDPEDADLVLEEEVAGLTREELLAILFDAGIDAGDPAEDAPFYSPDQSRGQPENAGQFGPGGGGASVAEKPAAHKGRVDIGLTDKEEAAVARIVKNHLKIKGGLTPATLASLAGAPDDADVEVRPGGDGKSLAITARNTDFKASRRLRRLGSGELVMVNDSIDVRPAARGGGVGSDVFARQVRACVANGVDSIRCHAARKDDDGEDSFNGYYTWPRLGYDESFEELVDDDPGAAGLVAQARSLFPGAESVLDVFATEEGRDWWKEHGTDLHAAKFDLSEGLRSRRVLDAYLAGRAARAPAPVASAAFSAVPPEARGRGVEEIDLAPWEEEALEAAWDKLTGGDAPFYDPSQPRHPAGSSVGGRWVGGVAAGTQSARDAAHQAVRDFASGQGPPTARDAHAVALHLSRLTVAQVHALKASLGIKGSAPNKAALVAKVAQRIRALRAQAPASAAVPAPNPAPAPPHTAPVPAAAYVPMQPQAAPHVSTPAPAAPPAPVLHRGANVITGAPATVTGAAVAYKAEQVWTTGKPEPGVLNGISFAPAPPTFWEKVKDVDVGEPPPARPVNRAGVLIREPDGRVWIVQPTNRYGNRDHTLPGGGVEPGLSVQQNALKEVWEETGLQVEITGYAGDFEDSNNKNNGRLYFGRRVGGAPWDAKVEPHIVSQKTGNPAAESETVTLVTPERAAQLLHRTDDLAQLAIVHPISLKTKVAGQVISKIVGGVQPKAREYARKKKAAGEAPGDATLHAIQEARGFNGKPKVVSKADFDALVAKGGHTEMLRGLAATPPSSLHGSTSLTPAQMAEQFKTGDHFPGHGMFGVGTYADSTKGHNNAATGTYSGGGEVMRIALPDTAKVIKFADLKRATGYDSPADYHVPGGKSPADYWRGAHAALAGYDAIHVDNPHQYGHGYYIILNRSILTVQDAPVSKSYTIK